ncbi:MAG TPA: metal ABC transporter permease [Pirellulales bacterium]
MNAARFFRSRDGLSLAKRTLLATLSGLLVVWLAPGVVSGQEPAAAEAVGYWPSADQWARVFTLRDYNTRVVVAGTTLLGVCSGVVGVFMLLRKRSLVGDVVSHSALPGVAGAFLLMETLSPGADRSLPLLLVGAFCAGSLGVLTTTVIRRFSRIKEDAALAIVLSIFFGLGVVLLTVAQQTPTGNAAGLQHFIYGKAAAMVASDVQIIAIAAAVVLSVCTLLFKEFAVLCFDPEYAASQGWPTAALDLLLMALVTVTTVVGMQSVGLLLVTALLITPAASARFWTDRLGATAFVAGFFGGVSALAGAGASALFPKLAAGATIVLAGSLVFLLSLLFGARRGVVPRFLAQRKLEAALRRRSLLATLYELLEHDADALADAAAASAFAISETPSSTDAAAPSGDDVFYRPVLRERLALAQHRPLTEIAPTIGDLERLGLLRPLPNRSLTFTPKGLREAENAVLNDRLWETYLRADPEVARTRVDRDADDLATVLEPELLSALRSQAAERYPYFAQRVFAAPPAGSAAHVQ